MVKRAYPPGLAGKRRKRRLSDYGKALREKQRLRSWYGLSERQFKKYVKEVLSKRGKVENLAEEFIKKLEKRLDNVIFRLGFSKSRSQARQLVLHGYFLINKKPITMPSYEVKKGDAIAIKEGKKRKTALKDLSATLKKKQVASWLKIDKDKLEAELTGEPSLGEVLPPAEIPTIFEYYSR